MEIDTRRRPTENELDDICLSHHPLVQELETFKAHCEYESTIKVTELKLSATTTVPTVLEETMSVVQLFDSGSPLWARPYSISELSFIIAIREGIGDKTFKQLLGQATDYKTLSQALIEAV